MTECPHCRRVRVDDDGVCEKCGWDARGGDYASITRPYEYDQFGRVVHKEDNNPFGLSPVCLCGGSWPCERA